MKRKPTIYVAGPMRGYENYNYDAFDYRARKLREMSWEVINPAEMDRDISAPPTDPMEFDPAESYEDREFMRDALKRDMVAICNECTAIYMMAEWENSRGAQAEWHLAKALGLEIHYEVPLPKYSE